jgi:hypothetical protein
MGRPRKSVAAPDGAVVNHYIQNFQDHNLAVSVWPVDDAGNFVYFNPIKVIEFLGKRHAPKNITIVSDEDWDVVSVDPTVAANFASGLWREIDALPASYTDASDRTAAAELRAEEAEKKTANAQADLDAKIAMIEELEKKLNEAGIK